VQQGPQLGRRSRPPTWPPTGPSIPPSGRSASTCRPLTTTRSSRWACRSCWPASTPAPPGGARAPGTPAKA